MAPPVLILVLVAALLHASWNALVKTGGDPFVRLAVINVVGGLAALPALALAAPPAPASWPWLLGSVAVHQIYYLALAYGYRFGDLSLVYPIARGVAPPLVLLSAWVVAGERPGPIALLAVLVISAAIVSLARGREGGLASPRALGFALATGGAIAAYTLLDGLGGRAAGAVVGYIAWLFVLDAIPFAVVVAWRRHGHLRAALIPAWRPAVVGGVLSLAAYGLVIWAMSIAPMASVSALRETSVIMAALIGSRLLREPLGARRVVAAVAVATGVIMLQMGGVA